MVPGPSLVGCRGMMGWTFPLASQRQTGSCGLDRVRALGLNVREDRSRVHGEGRSIYFHDDDNHLFELHTGTLTQRLTRYAQSRPSTTSADKGELLPTARFGSRASAPRGD